MKPRECKYCEQSFKFTEFDSHVGYCGTKTKKCFECQRNVCHKDMDSHKTGGECQVYQDEDARKRKEQLQKEIEEEKRFKAKQEMDKKKI
jgi:hypothetical protein